MNRRNFIVGAGAGLGAFRPGSKTLTAAVASSAIARPSYSTGRSTERTYRVLGVPLPTGSLYPGNENDAQAYRDVKLLTRLQAAGCNALDDGNVAIPSYLPHHSIPPIRSWPGPRIAWDLVTERVAPLLQQPGQVPLLIGCDCSVVVGTAQALRRASAGDLHVLYVDGDFDDAAPDPERCQSAASLAVWFLTNSSPFCSPALRPSQVTVMAWSNPSHANQTGIGSVPLTEVRRLGPREAAQQALAAIPESSPILLHFDVDVFQRQEMPSAYFPHPEGLSMSEGRALLGVLLKDPRVRIIEVSEYATLRDPDQRWINQLVDLLAEGLKV